MKFLAYLVSGISLGSIYAIIALGYTMVYGIAKMLNFAHGDVIMVGGYISFLAATNLGLPTLLSVLVAMAFCTVLGILIEGLAYRPLRSAPSLAVLITAIGVSYFLQNAALLIFGANPKAYTPVVSGTLKLFGDQLSISYVSIVTVVCCVVIMLALTAFTGKTRMGKAMRACSEDKGAAQPHHLPDLRHRLGSGGGRGRTAVLLLAHADADHRLHARHQGLYRRSVRRHRLHPRRVHRRHPPRRDRVSGPCVYLHPAFQLHRLRGADHHPAGAPGGPPGQAHAGKGLRRCRYEYETLLQGCAC